MDTKYKVILTNRAESELNDIYDYIANTFMEEKTANNLMKKIENDILLLSDTPEGFAVIENYRRKDFEYRRLPINNYVAIYRVDKENKKVYIVRIVYGGRNYLNEL